tara:strand:- start:11470 stop:12213 length:744 start_codon:yes stop_codon:yes gene_type:complete
MKIRLPFITEKKASQVDAVGAMISTSIFCLIFFAIISIWFDEHLPVGMFDFFSEIDIKSGIMHAWPIFLWGGGFTAVVAILTKNNRILNEDAEGHMVKGFWSSAAAGFFEEICFRWALFLSATIGVQFVNWLFLGFVDGWMGPIKWLHLTIFGPLATFMTFGAARDLMLGMGWVIGAAILSANAKFRDGHKYLGIIGVINSWYIGLYLFYVAFAFGLPAAIIVHFLYDLLIHAVIYVDRVFERWMDR